jgi:hypothetical protein
VVNLCSVGLSNLNGLVRRTCVHDNDFVNEVFDAI